MSLHDLGIEVAKLREENGDLRVALAHAVVALTEIADQNRHWNARAYERTAQAALDEINKLGRDVSGEPNVADLIDLHDILSRCDEDHRSADVAGGEVRALVAIAQAARRVERWSPHKPHPGVPCIKCELSDALAVLGGRP